MQRVEREKLTVSRMISIYCHSHHNTCGKDICVECASLEEYAHKRLSLCPKGNGKTSCRKCEIHCYSPKMKEEIRKVMRYVGPRMLLISPLAAIRHLISEIR